MAYRNKEPPFEADYLTALVIKLDDYSDLPDDYPDLPEVHEDAAVAK